MNIKMVDLGRQYLKLKSEIDLSIQTVIDHGRFIGGSEVNDFAENFAAYNTVRHVIPCGNGTDALQIALMAQGFSLGDEVLVPSFTFVASAESVSILGLKPVFIDVNPDNFTIDPDKIEEKINSRTVAIMPVHLYGQNANMEQILKVAEAHNLKVIEDAAQSVGASYNFSNGETKKSGAIGNIGTTSFFPSKNLGAYGDGGAILTNDDELADNCRQIANHGQSEKYYSNRIGVNSRLDTIQAAILNVKLQYLDEFNKARQERAAVYDQLLSSVEGLIIPQRAEYSNHVFHQYTIKVPAQIRERLRDQLSKNKVPTMVYYPNPLHKQKPYTGYISESLEHTDALSESVLSLPMHPELSMLEQEYITNLIIDFFKHNI